MMAISWNDDRATPPPSEPRRYSVNGLTARQIRILRTDVRFAIAEYSKGLAGSEPLDDGDASDRAQLAADYAEIQRAIEIAHSYAEIMQ